MESALASMVMRESFPLWVGDDAITRYKTVIIISKYPG